MEADVGEMETLATVEGVDVVEVEELPPQPARNTQSSNPQPKPVRRTIARQ